MLPIAILILALRELGKHTYYADGTGQQAGVGAFVSVIIVFGVTLLQALFSTIIAVWLGKKRWFWLVPVSYAYHLKSMNLVSNLRSWNRYRANREHFGILLLRRYVSLALDHIVDNSESNYEELCRNPVVLSEDRTLRDLAALYMCSPTCPCPASQIN
jgi:hypothetical protein